ncbi:hypothetical protein [Flavobacterium aurantiibacter]|uniref:Uncharacterized protein n=1 Tax=Flavobacterium aurantiibacter TaxID=2023067 RepID=A0A255ZX46_9FLAO|nr:hypothetical protein [Flavobacterium aurantiibacter]OYQ45949.1 hypothetical protein CHX27_05390 [Flavobacterium aurantiibacter]
MKTPALARILLLFLLFLFHLSLAQNTGIPVIASFGRYASENGGCLGGRGICSFSAAIITTKNAVLYELENGTIRLVIDLETLPDTEKQNFYRQNNLFTKDVNLFVQEEKITVPESLFHKNRGSSRDLLVPAGNYPMQSSSSKITIDFKPVRTTAP